MIVALIATVAAAHADSPGQRASVVWRAGDRVYLASADSNAFAPAARITLLLGDSALASGTIERQLDGALAVMRVTSGALSNAIPLDHLRVRMDGAFVAPLPRLRVGIPASARANPLVACAVCVPLAPVGSAYSVTPGARGGLDLVRVAEMPGAPWPDTLMLRPFSDAADEEIALERGELDVAVFWPGERSSHLREDPRWRDAPRGVRARGVLVAMSTGLDARAPQWAVLNAQLCGGDLVACATGDSTATSTAPSGAVRWTVDSALPAHRAIERLLAHTAPTAAPGARTVRLTLLDVPAAPADSLAARMPASSATPLFYVACPVVATAAARASVDALGADAFANLFGCAAPGRQP